MLDRKNKSFIIVLIGVSGSGKSTLRKYANENIGNIKNLIAVTNRLARTNEQNGVDKFFFSNDEFDKATLNNELCLINKVYNNLYAFRVSDFLTGDTYLAELHYDSYDHFVNYHGNTVNIYIRPFSLMYAQEGIYSRGASKIENDTRINSLQQEHYALEKLNKQGFFDYTFVNQYNDSSLTEFTELLIDIITKRRNNYEDK